MKYQANKGKYCSVSGCKNKARVKGLCKECYNLKRKKGEEKSKKPSLDSLRQEKE
jgi:hypothetical protein